MRLIPVMLLATLAGACQREGHGPPADCTTVGTHAAAFELGNYAPPETRAPTVAKFVARCKAAGVDQRQGACVLAAKDVWSAAVCAPRLFPDVKIDGDCDAIARKIGEAMRKQYGSGPSVPPDMQRMADRVAGALRTSCAQDGWPDALKACMLATRDILDDGKACEKLTSPELTAKLQARLTASMQGP